MGREQYYTGTHAFLPAAEWLRGYGRPQFGADLLAGVTLAAYLLPAAIGDASLVRLPPEAGPRLTKPTNDRSRRAGIALNSRR